MNTPSANPDRTEKIRLLLLAVLGLVVFLGFHDYNFDDPFITYRVADNLAAGKGWVYNAGEHINAATSPLWTLLLALLHLVTGIDVPSLGPPLSILFLILAAELLARALTPRLSDAAATIAAVMVVINPNFALTAGMETMLLFVMVLAAIVCYQREKWMATGFFLALAILARMDASVFVAIVAVHFLYTRRRFFPRAGVVAFALPLLFWFGFSIWYFGAFEPTTLAVKIAQRKSGGHWGAGYILLNHLGLILAKDFLTWDPLNLLMLALLGFGLATLVHERSFAGLALLAWAAGHVIAYGIILNVPGYAWYFTPVFLAIQVVLAVGVVRLVQSQGWALRVWPFLAVGLLAAWAVGWFAFSSRSINQLLTPIHLNHFFFYLAIIPLTLLGVKSLADRWSIQVPAMILVTAAAVVPLNFNGWLQPSHFPHPQYRNYPLAAKYITANLPKAKTVGTNEIGILGWYLKDYQIVDQCGIPNPEAAEHLGRGEFTWWLQRYHPDVLVLHPDLVFWKHLEEPIKTSPWFPKAYRLATTFEAGRTGPPWGRSALEIWEKVDDAAIPTVVDANEHTP